MKCEPRCEWHELLQHSISSWWNGHDLRTWWMFGCSKESVLEQGLRNANYLLFQMSINLGFLEIGSDGTLSKAYNFFTVLALEEFEGYKSFVQPEIGMMSPPFVRPASLFFVGVSAGEDQGLAYRSGMDSTCGTMYQMPAMELMSPAPTLDNAVQVDTCWEFSLQVITKPLDNWNFKMNRWNAFASCLTLWASLNSLSAEKSCRTFWKMTLFVT